MAAETGRLVVPSPEDVALETLLAKFAGWLKQQPEWPVLFLGGRQARRKAAKALSHAIYTIPLAETSGLSRSLRRAYERS